MSIDLDKLESLAQTVTPGPWENAGPWQDGFGETWWVVNSYGPSGHTIGESSEEADFIAAANPTVVLEMIALIRRQEEELKAAREVQHNKE